jgi:hypoxanthine phosphoribosyltransferase
MPLSTAGRFASRIQGREWNRRKTLQTQGKLDLDGIEAQVLFTGDQIRGRIEEMGESLRGRFRGDCPVFVGLLHSGFVFLSDLIRAYGQPHEIDFLKVSRYDVAHKEATAVRVLQDLRSEVRDRPVVVVEAIRAHGTKIEYVERFLRLHGPKRIEYCALVVPARANRNVAVHEAGFAIEDEYVVGYGLDYQERFRHLDCIAEIVPRPAEVQPEPSGN